MKNLFIKSTSIALSALMLAGALAACGGSKQSDAATSAATALASVSDTSAARLQPNVPDADYGGYTFTFLTHKELTLEDWITNDPRELIADQETGEAINDAVYKRNATISDKYNVKFAMVDNNDEVTQLKKAVASGDSTFDCAMIINHLIPTAITANILMEMGNLRYLDRSKPYWDPAANAMTIDNKCYVLAGDLTILDKESTEVLFFNKSLIANYGLQSPYDLVNSGAWTFDKLGEMIKGTAADINGDGKMDENDQYGLVSYNDTLHSMLISGGGALAVKDANDEPVMSLATPQNITIANAAMDILYDKSTVYNVQATFGGGLPAQTVLNAIFSENRTLFTWAKIDVATQLRSMTEDFGIIPFPKYQASQPNYLSVVNGYSGAMIAIPKTVSDTDRTGAILEALACESRYTLQPAYYDETLQRKMARDEDSRGMLDIIFANKVYDIGAVYAFGNCFLDYLALYSKYNTDVASYYAKNQAKMNSDIQKVLTVFQSN